MLALRLCLCSDVHLCKIDHSYVGPKADAGLLALEVNYCFLHVKQHTPVYGRELLRRPYMIYLLVVSTYEVTPVWGTDQVHLSTAEQDVRRFVHQAVLLH